MLSNDFPLLDGYSDERKQGDVPMTIRKAAKWVLRNLGLLRKPPEFELRKRYPQYDIGEASYGGAEVFGFTEADHLVVGKYTSVAKSVRIILGGEHRTDWVTTYPFPDVVPEHSSLQGHPGSKGPVIIGNDVWIGIGAMILSGVRIGDGAVISAGAVVTKDIPPYAIAGGNPAKVIRNRFPPEQVEAFLRIRWWDWPDDRVHAEIPALCSDNVEDFIRRHDRVDGSANGHT